ncbi:uncharacterized protein [Ptychodera flava]|uniref:uncharacterized protein n=1 Tax=Ptychodera flava TaxID=63121 RepID=UPI00396A8413
MDKFRPPEPLKLEGNLSENWRRWKQRFQLYMEASEANEKPEKNQCSIFLHVVGDEALEAYNTFTFTNAADKEKIQVLYEKFEEYCSPRKNVTLERHKFFTCSQGPDESIDHYVTELKNRSKSCTFGELTNSLIKDRVVRGVNNSHVRERLLRETDLDPQKPIEICRAAEQSKTHIQALSKMEEKPVYGVRKMQPRK